MPTRSSNTQDIHAGHLSRARIIALVAALLTLFTAAQPSGARASVSVGANVGYQVNESTSNNRTNSNTQERIGLVMNVNSNPNPKLTYTAILKLDIVKRIKDPGGESTELQPNFTLKLSTQTFQLNTGYKNIMRDETITTAGTTKNQTTDSSDIVADMSFRAGRWPDIRLKYLTKTNQQEVDGTLVRDGKTDDFKAAANYRLGLINFSGDYSTQTITDRLSSSTSDKTQGSMQVGMDTRLGRKVNVGLRDSYRFSNSTNAAGVANDRKTNLIDARMQYTPIERGRISANYSILSETSSANGKTDETKWTLAADYMFRKYLRVYGSLTNRDTQSTANPSTNATTVYGANFSHRAGRVNFVARIENRTDKKTSTAAVLAANDSTNTRTNIDWQMDVRLSDYLTAGLSESYVTSKSGGINNTSDRYRLKAAFGPVLNFSVAPYIDISKNQSGSTPATTQTEIAVPIKYNLQLTDNVSFSAIDTYRSRTSQSGGNATSNNTSNNLTFKLQVPKLINRISFSGDASFVTNTTDTSSSSNSLYALRATWNNNPHTVNASYKYQTGTGKPASTAMSLQYNLRLAMRKINMSLQASYSYKITAATANVASSTAQSMFVTLSIRK